MRLISIKLRLFILIPICGFVACNTNEDGPEYHKDLAYDGFSIALDTVNMKTYKILKPQAGSDSLSLQSDVTRWFDQNGYHSMTKNITFMSEVERITTEKITRDINSLPTGRDIMMESKGTEPLVTLARLKKRSGGIEEWLYRHYFDSKRYIEDASTIYYSANSKIVEQNQAGSNIASQDVEIFDNGGRMVLHISSSRSSDRPILQTFYNEQNRIDSVVARYYVNGDSTQQLIKKNTEYYQYILNERGLPKHSVIYQNDTAIYQIDYQYGYR